MLPDERLMSREPAFERPYQPQSFVADEVFALNSLSLPGEK